MDWTDEKLKKDIRRIFEPQYKHQLKNAEVEEISRNLLQFSCVVKDFAERRSWSNSKLGVGNPNYDK